MSGKKPILSTDHSIVRIHSPNEITKAEERTEGRRPGYYQQFFGENFALPTPLTADPKLLKQHEAEGYLSEIQTHQPVKGSLSIGSRIINLPNLTTDRPAQNPRTCTKSVHKVVFLFCSVTLAIIIACIIFVEMKKMQMDEQEY